MARYADLMEIKNDTQRMNAIRDRVTDVIETALKAEFGDEFAFKLRADTYITPNAVKVAKMTVVADVGDVLDNGKCTVGACVEVSAKVKKWNTICTKNGTTQYGVCLDDYKEG